MTAALSAQLDGGLGKSSWIGIAAATFILGVVITAVILCAILR